MEVGYALAGLISLPDLLDRDFLLELVVCSNVKGLIQSAVDLTYTMADHPYKIELTERMSWILIVEKNANPASLRLERLVWNGRASPVLKVVPVHQCDILC
jgi:hypothetical protein